jgi:DNA-binding IscR family transcriptional regulator
VLSRRSKYGLKALLALVPCVSQTAYARCVECVDEETCGVRIAMQRVRDATAQILDHTTLTDLNRTTARKRTAGKRGTR